MKYAAGILAVLSVMALFLALGLASTSAEVVSVTPTVTPLPDIPEEALPTVPPEPVVPPSANFSGSAWVNARPSIERITAKIGDVVCGEATPGQRGGPPSFYTLYVASDEVVPGCGKPGSRIAFFVGSDEANETAEWQASDRIQFLRLTVGPPFAMFSGKLTLTNPPVQEEVLPFVGSNACGYQLNPWMGAGPTYGYSVVVYPRELVQGCGFDGAEVTFKLVNKETREVTAEAMGTAIWHPMAAEDNVNLAFTSVPVVQVPVAGSDGGESGVTWAPFVVVAAVLLPAAGLSLLLVRRKSTPRAH